MKRKLGFLGKQLLAYALALLLFLTLLVFWVYSYVVNISTENAAINQEQLTTATLEQVNNYFDKLMLLAAQISHDTEVVQIMSQLWTNPIDSSANYFAEESPERATLTEILENHNRAKDPAQRISVFNWRGDFLCTDPTAKRLATGSQYMQENYRGLINYVFSDPDRDHLLRYPTPDPLREDENDEEWYIFLVMPIRDASNKSIWGYVEIMQSSSELFALLELDDLTNIDAYLLDYYLDEHIIQLCPRETYYGDILKDDNYHITEAKTDYAWTVALVQDQDQLLAPYRTAVVYLLLGVAALVIVLFLCVYLIAKYTNKPVLELSRKVKHLNLDSLSEHPIAAQATNEVKELDRAVDTMIQRLRNSVALEKKAYLSALQAQMNPHFLYNCLSTISGMCIIGRTENIPKLCNRLAAILRYETTYDNKSITLKDELKNVTDYLELMRLRYEKDFEYQLRVDEALLTLPMPRLMLQPIVENCFEHGFRDVAPPWRITIEVFREEHQWCITVCDNGCGLEEEKRQQILDQVDSLLESLGHNYSELQIGGLGLVNTILRLRLLTEDTLVYNITPGTPGGTIVTLKGTMNDESPDRGG